VAVALVMASLASGCRDLGDNPCAEAAALCATGVDVPDSACAGDERAYAECVLDRDDCSMTTLTVCAGAGAGGGGDATGMTLEVHQASLDSNGYFTVEVDLVNPSMDRTAVVAVTEFFVEDAAGGLHRREFGGCGADAVAPGGRTSCNPSWTWRDQPATPALLVYLDGGRRVEAGLSSAPSGLEDTAATCADGISNDGDAYVDCDDYDCCDVRTDCPPTSSCGQLD